MRVFVVTCLELRRARLDLRLEIGPLLRGHLFVLGDQHFDGGALRQLDRLVRHDLPVLDVRSDRPRTSVRPSVTVLIASPVARATAAIPPQPIASASAPAHKRRARSSIVAVSRRHFRLTSCSASTTNVDHVRVIVSFPNRPRSIDLFIRAP